MAQAWLLIIDPKITPSITGFIERLHSHKDQKSAKQEGYGIELLEAKVISQIYGNSKVEKGDFVCLCVKPLIIVPSSPADKEAPNIGGGIYVRLQKDGNAANSYIFKERYIYKSMYKTYLSTLPFIPILEEEDFPEGLHFLGNK